MSDAAIQIPGYRVLRCDRARSMGGGVCLYFRFDIFAADGILALNFPLTNIESLLVRISVGGLVLHLLCLYRPPSTGPEDDRELCLAIATIADELVNLVVVGDFNFRTISWPIARIGNTDSAADNFSNVILQSPLRQLVRGPTRFRHGVEPSLLDLILTNDPNLVQGLSHLPPIGRSDHCCLQFCIQVISHQASAPAARFNPLSANFDAIDAALASADWTAALAGSSVDAQWVSFMGGIGEALPPPVPPRSTCRYRCPWITRDVGRLIREKHTLWRSYRRTKNSILLSGHRKASNHLTNILRRARSDYEAGLLTKGPKSYFRYVRSRLSSWVTVPLLSRPDGTLCESNQEVANALADQFVSAFTIEPPGPLPTFPPNTRICSSLTSVNLSPGLVRAQLAGVTSSCAPGPDELHPSILGNCPDSLAGPLSAIMQSSLESGRLPEPWLKADITAIYKKGDKLNPANYRPISNTSVACKTMERLVVRELRPFLLEHGVIARNQHGFTPGRSTVTNLLEVTDSWTRTCDDGGVTDVIYLDFARAFDKVPHRRLLSKLDHMGVRGRLLGWIRAFLSGRTFRVKVGADYSDPRPVTSGVPQGSVLGPVLFLVYISDLMTTISSPCSLYADDTKLFGNPLSPNNLQSDLLRIHGWTSTWLLPLNEDKCSVLHIGVNNPRSQYLINSSIISPVDSQLDLGILISEDLSWTPQVARVVRKANSTLYLIRRSFAPPKPALLRSLYVMYVLPVLMYASSVWAPFLVRDGVGVGPAQSF